MSIPQAPARSILSRLLDRFSIHNVSQGFLRSRFRRAGLQEKYTNVGDAVVHYWIGGQGPPLVLLHGFGGDATYTWHGQVRALARKHTLIVPDLLWFGDSTASIEDYSLDFQARCAVALADAEGIDRFDLTGVSYGGLVAFALTHNHGERVRRLIMVDSPGPAYTDTDHQDMLDRFAVDNVASIIIPQSPDGVRTLLELAWHRPPPTPHFVLRDVYRNLFLSNVHHKRGLLLWLDEQRQIERIDPWQVPHRTLVVWGADDPLFSVGVAERLVAALPAAELLVLEKTRHAPNVERPRPFNNAVLEFLGA